MGQTGTVDLASLSFYGGRDNKLTEREVFFTFDGNYSFRPFSCIYVLLFWLSLEALQCGLMQPWTLGLVLMFSLFFRFSLSLSHTYTRTHTHTPQMSVLYHLPLRLSNHFLSHKVRYLSPHPRWTFFFVPGKCRRNLPKKDNINKRTC